MPVLEHESPVRAFTRTTSRQRLRIACRVLVIALAACQVWTYRYVTDPDGTAYVDIARAWLRGDWAHALNSYWSPLYVWLLSAAFGVFHPSIHWQLPLMHAVNFAGFIAAFAAWEWLTSEWERWQGPSSYPMLTDVFGYYVVSWAGMVLASIGWYETPDVFVMAALVAAGALLVRVRRSAARNRDFVLLGLILGACFLAKTALVAVIPVFILVLAALLGTRVHSSGRLGSFLSAMRSVLDRRVLITAATIIVVAAPFVAAISIVHHRFTIGDSGWLNYSWHVTGMSVEGYKENAYWPGAEIRHPIHVLMQHPRVLGYEQHLVGTFPIHSDISWWCEGYPVRFNLARQLMILWSDIRFSLNAFRCKAIFLVLIGLFFGAGEMARRFAQAWFIWVPALFLAVAYCPVASEVRYLAGSYALIGFSLIAAAWRIRLPQQIPGVATWVVPSLLAAVLIGGNLRHMTRPFISDISGRTAPLGYGTVETAETMRREGLRPGDRVAYIGSSLGAAHVGLERAQIVAVVPQRITHDDRVAGRPLVMTFPQPDAFWRSGPDIQQKALAAFRSVGAKWVFADNVPQWADTTGWRAAGATSVRPGNRPFVYFRKLG